MTNNEVFLIYLACTINIVIAFISTSRYYLISRDNHKLTDLIISQMGKIGTLKQQIERQRGDIKFLVGKIKSLSH